MNAKTAKTAILTAALWLCYTMVAAAPMKKSAEAEALMSYLQSIYGQKTLSGTMANVNWNINEAQWVHQHTGVWPALNCFDYIHLPFTSKGGWIDYSNTSVVEQWHNAGGIVAIMWHWNMPANSGGGYSFYYGTKSDQTTFDVKKIFNTSSTEYQRMMSDIDKVADLLLLLKQKGIPVLWRPLHEAGGQWFWWGMDPEACNELWRVMYDRFEQKGLDNLIWVWTQSSAWGKPYSDGYRWYPGDEYVDIVGMDVYNNTNASNIYTTCYQFLTDASPDKLVALTECGNVAQIGQQWSSGAKWLFFMPWYDYDRTKDTSAAAFKSTAHSHANAAWWNEAFNHDYVLTRDDVKDAMTSGIHEVDTYSQENANPSSSAPFLDSDAYYTLDGRKVLHPQRHGVYIHRGKSIIVKK